MNRFSSRIVSCTTLKSRMVFASGADPNMRLSDPAPPDSTSLAAVALDAVAEGRCGEVLDAQKNVAWRGGADVGGAQAHPHGGKRDDIAGCITAAAARQKVAEFVADNKKPPHNTTFADDAPRAPATWASESGAEAPERGYRRPCEPAERPITRRFKR